MKPNKLQFLKNDILGRWIRNSLYQEYTNGRATHNPKTDTKCCEKWVNILKKKLHSRENTGSFDFSWAKWRQKQLYNGHMATKFSQHMGVNWGWKLPKACGMFFVLEFLSKNRVAESGSWWRVAPLLLTLFQWYCKTICCGDNTVIVTSHFENELYYLLLARCKKFLIIPTYDWESWKIRLTLCLHMLQAICYKSNDQIYKRKILLPWTQLHSTAKQPLRRKKRAYSLNTSCTSFNKVVVYVQLLSYNLSPNMLVNGMWIKIHLHAAYLQ